MGFKSNANGNTTLQSFVSKLLKSAEDALVPPLWEKRGKKVFFFHFFILFVHAAARDGTCAFTLKVVNTVIKNSSCDDRHSIST